MTDIQARVNALMAPSPYDKLIPKLPAGADYWKYEDSPIEYEWSWLASMRSINRAAHHEGQKYVRYFKRLFGKICRYEVRFDFSVPNDACAWLYLFHAEAELLRLRLFRHMDQPEWYPRFNVQFWIEGDLLEDFAHPEELFTVYPGRRDVNDELICDTVELDDTLDRITVHILQAVEFSSFTDFIQHMFAVYGKELAEYFKAPVESVPEIPHTLQLSPSNPQLMPFRVPLNPHSREMNVRHFRINSSNGRKKWRIPHHEIEILAHRVCERRNTAVTRFWINKEWVNGVGAVLFDGNITSDEELVKSQVREFRKIMKKLDSLEESVHRALARLAKPALLEGIAAHCKYPILTEYFASTVMEYLDDS
jgi:hypothetical protein